MGGLFGRMVSGIGTKMTAEQEMIWRDLFGSRVSGSGVTVNYKTALETSAWLAGTRVIAEGISQVPFKLFQKQGTKLRLATDHPLYDILGAKPNDVTTSFEFRETAAFHTVLGGNAYAWKFRVGSRREYRALELIEPGYMRTLREGGRTRYFARIDGETERELQADDIWHLRGPSWCGWTGLDAVKLAREVLGLTIATEQSQARMHKDGLKKAGTYSVDGPLTVEQHSQITAWLKEFASARSGDPLVLDRGAKWLETQMTGVDAQHLETRKFQIEEICRSLRVMPIMLGVPGAAGAYDNGETMFIAHVMHTLLPWYERIQQSADAFLLSEDDRRNGFYTKFIPAALMRGSAKDRGEYFAKALGAGGQKPWMTQDEVRELEELELHGGPAGELGQGMMQPKTNSGQGSGS